MTLFATPTIRHRVNLTSYHLATQAPLTTHPVCAQSLTPSGDPQARHLPMFKSSMKIIQAKLFWLPRSANPEGAEKNQVKGVFMLFRRFSKFLTAAALAIAFVACAGIAGGSEAKAQGYYRNYNQNRHRDWDRDAFRRQRERERFFFLRQRQREREYCRPHDRFDRSRYYNRFGRSSYYRRW